MVYPYFFSTLDNFSPIFSPLWLPSSSENDRSSECNFQSSVSQCPVTARYAVIILDVHPSKVNETWPGAFW
jgi:hypothetical protein